MPQPPRKSRSPGFKRRLDLNSISFVLMGKPCTNKQPSSGPRLPWMNAPLSNRAKMAAHHELVSQRMTRFMLDVAKVLTPEQRTKIAEHLQSRREHMMSRFGGHRPQK